MAGPALRGAFFVAVFVAVFVAFAGFVTFALDGLAALPLAALARAGARFGLVGLDAARLAARAAVLGAGFADLRDLGERRVAMAVNRTAMLRSIHKVHGRSHARQGEGMSRGCDKQ